MLARRVMDAMARRMLPAAGDDPGELLAGHAWERTSPHTGGWRL
jgi:hypothetical protein